MQQKSFKIWYCPLFFTDFHFFLSISWILSWRMVLQFQLSFVLWFWFSSQGPMMTFLKQISLVIYWGNTNWSLFHYMLWYLSSKWQMYFQVSLVTHTEFSKFFKLAPFHTTLRRISQRSACKIHRIAIKRWKKWEKKILKKWNSKTCLSKAQRERFCREIWN